MNSIATTEQLASHYAAVQGMYDDAIRDDLSLDYLGRRPGTLVHPCAEETFGRYFATEQFAAAFQTEELAIDPEELALLLRAAIAQHPNIRFLPRHHVLGIQRLSDGFQIDGQGVNGPWQLRANQVVNALWDGRIAVDRSLGIEPAPGWVYRLKFRVIAELPPILLGAPSVTMVLGPFGDIVVRSNGLAYLSWYPGGMRGWSKEPAPPPAWDRFCRADLTKAERVDVVHSILLPLDSWFPHLKFAEPVLVDAGVIVAYGETDVDDRHSGLHDRTRIGVQSVSGYHSVDPGKLTTAPMFALLAADRVVASIDSRVGSSSGAIFG